MIKCNACATEYEVIEEDLPDGVYTEICTVCLEPFTYVMKNGEIYEFFDPPTVTQTYKGKGEPGGK